ncbi:MAG TPA: T9SS type A sorting domain-containing protein [Bacteroidia bacterium]|jgi:hypothetical protein|nr:T9SS type A sorting domain-containing protein [Bacteroidia bacterium]
MRPINLKKVILLLFVLVTLINDAKAQVPPLSPKWSALFDSGVGGKRDLGYAVTTDASGNVYVTGTQNITFYPNYYDSKVTTRKYSSTGTLLHTTSYSGSTGLAGCDAEVGYCIATDGTYLWVAASTYNLNGGNKYLDFTLLKYNCSDLSLVSSDYPKKYADMDGCVSTGQLRASCLVLASTGSGTQCFIGGNTYDGTNWATLVTKDSSAAGQMWAWTRKYSGTSSAGNVDGNEHCITDIKVSDDDTKVYVAGYVANTSTNTGKRDWYTAVLNASDGSYVSGWPVIYDNSAHKNDVPCAIDFDSNGNVYVAGYKTNSSDYTDALLIKYPSTGSTASFTQSYTGSGGAWNAWVDLVVVGTSTSTPAVFVGGYATRATQDYAVAAYTSSGGLSTSWSTNPNFYDGHDAGGDAGFGIEYSSGTSRVYIFGKADEGTSGIANINISTVGFSSTNGTKVWGPASYDCTTDAYPNGVDETNSKYGFVNKYYDDGCYTADHLYIVGDAFVSGHDYDYVTLKYSPSGACTDRLGGRLKNNVEEISGTLHPNPFSSSTELNISGGVQLTNAELTVYDMTGRIVISKQHISSNIITIEKGSTPNGLYFYKLVENGDLLYSGKFIISEQ